GLVLRRFLHQTDRLRTGHGDDAADALVGSERDEFNGRQAGVVGLGCGRCFDGDLRRHLLRSGELVRRHWATVHLMRWAGRMALAIVPGPSSLSSKKRPPCISTNALVRGSPRPG